MEPHFKVCSKCEKEKSRSDFHKDAGKKDGLLAHCKACVSAYKKRWYRENRGRELEYRKQYNQKNREWLSEYKKRWYQENREWRLDYKKKWDQENPEYKKRWEQENRSRRLEYLRNWRRENPEKHSANLAKRRALRKGNTPNFILDCPEERSRMEKVYKLRDLLTEATGIEHHVDHIWPLSKGGPHWSGNLQIITAEENLSKGDKLCEETAKVIQESLDEHCSFRYGE